MYIFQFSYNEENILVLAENENRVLEIVNFRMDFDVDPYRIECLGSIDCMDVIERFPKIDSEFLKICSKKFLDSCIQEKVEFLKHVTRISKDNVYDCIRNFTVKKLKRDKVKICVERKEQIEEVDSFLKSDVNEYLYMPNNLIGTFDDTDDVFTGKYDPDIIGLIDYCEKKKILIVISNRYCD